MKKGTVVVNPYVLKTLNGKPNSLYATIFLEPHKTLTRNGEVIDWGTDTDVRKWETIGFIDLNYLFDNVLGETE